MQNNKRLIDCHCKPASHAFCSECQTVRHVRFVRNASRTRNVLSFTKFQGGMLQCEACDHVVAHLYREMSSAPAGKGHSLLQDAHGDAT